MKTTCLINNYNYAPYVGEAIDSVLSQTRPFDEIVIVDDGSTDESLSVIKAAIANGSNTHLIAKKNEGQLSCFNEGFKASSGDLIFFLDADDLYEPDYLEEVLNYYNQNNDCDFLFCTVTEFGLINREHRYCETEGNLGFSFIAALYGSHWIGGPTSSLSVRKKILEKILPIPFTTDWRTRADDCLVYGASLVGAKKYHLAKPLIRYRVHGKNRYYHKEDSKDNAYIRKFSIERLKNYILRKNFIPFDPWQWHLFIYFEFKEIQSPSYIQLRQYLGYVNLAKASQIIKLKIKRRIIIKFLKRKKLFFKRYLARHIKANK